MPGRIARKALSVCLPLRAAPCVGLAALGLIVSTGSLQTVVANGDTRSITLQHTHRDDSITVTFKRDGRYDQDALNKLNYFLRDWRNDDQTAMAPQLFDILWEVYREVDAKTPIRIVSSYRSPATNAMLRRRSRGVAQFSQHMLGKAIDFNIEGVAIEDLRVAGLRLQRGGVGFYPGSFVHMDVGSVRHWPRMTHDQLARVFPNGRTVHVPSDGQPLPGYALALADIEKRGSSTSGMSLAAARNAGAVSDDRIASAGSKKGGILSKLFGFSTDEDEDEGTAAAPAPRAVASTKPAEEPIARVPVPQARPATIDVASRNTKPAGGFALASATSVAVTLPPARDVPRPSAEMTGAAATRAETTASITSWLNDAEFGKPDRVPTNVALAYAANAAADTPRDAPSSRLIAPMGATTQVARIPPKAGQRYNDPWMRGITLATSVHYGMNVTVYGKLDVGQVRMMMIKPVSTVAMGFSGDPYEGMQTVKFAGAAVTFLPTVTFGAEPPQRQASLVR
ncbi:MAG: hypothetical protein V7604_92 [Hyphomicrobiales bacterium]|jgi:uncharacterized protein YcbK (DUF882 family)